MYWEQEEGGAVEGEYASCIWRLHIAPIVNDFLAQYQKSGWI